MIKLAPIRSKLIIAVPLLCMLFVDLWFATSKNLFHMDEMYTYLLAIGDDPFLGEFSSRQGWLEVKEVEKLITLNDENRFAFDQTYINQAQDVHPPLYYFFIRLCALFTTEQFSWWPGFVLNLIQALLMLFFISKILTLLEITQFVRTLILIFIAFNPLTISLFVFQRMYQQLALFIVISVYLQLKSFAQEKINFSIVVIGILGFLTHYYFLFFLTASYLYIFLYQRFNLRKLVELSMILLSTVTIFPPMLSHIFKSYRGVEVQQKITDLSLSNHLEKIEQFAMIIQKQLLSTSYSNVLVITIFLLVYACYFIFYKRETKASYLFIVFAIYFFLSAILSPYLDFRYVSSICFILFLFLAQMFNEIYLGGHKRVVYLCLPLLFFFLLIPGRNFELIYHQNSPLIDKINHSKIERLVIVFNQPYEIIGALQFALYKKKIHLRRWDENVSFDDLEKPFYLIDMSLNGFNNRYDAFRIIDEHKTDNIRHLNLYQF